MSDIEKHPLPPFLPANARLLMLGSFPPPRKRWSMEFYYPNMTNDMWRIMGLVFYRDKLHFLEPSGKAFSKERLSAFLEEKGIAVFDTATSIRRLQDNASDKFLEVVESTDIRALLSGIPQCLSIVTTGQKATETLLKEFNIPEPRIGSFSTFTVGESPMRLYRMPSTSRAYPLAIEKKAEFYRNMFSELGMI